MPTPEDTAHPPAPVEAPTAVQDAREGLEAGEGGPAVRGSSPGILARPKAPPGSPGTRGAANLAAAQRKATRRYGGTKGLLARARAMVPALEGRLGPPVEPPLPLGVACDLQGIPARTVSDALERGDLPEVAAARARGIELCLRAATRPDQDPKYWQWLAERLRPKDLHLPTKVLSGQDPDAAPAETRITIELADARALARGNAHALPADVSRQKRALPGRK